MKKAKYDWSKKIELKSEEERQQLWEEINYQKFCDKVRSANAKKSPVLVLPYFLFSTLYTLYLSYYVPFFKIKKPSKLDFLINYEGVKPLISWIGKLFKAIEIDEPVLSVIGFVVFAVVIPALFAVIIKALIKNSNIKKYAGQEEAFAETEKEQIISILGSRDAMVGIKAKHKSVLFKIGISFVSIINIVLFVSGRLIDATVAKDYEDNVIFLAVGVFVILNLIAQFIYKKIACEKSVNVISDIVKSVDVAGDRLKDIEDKEAEEAAEEAERVRQKEWLDKIKKGYEFIENKEYNKAEDELYKIRRYYDKKQTEICNWNDKRSEAYWNNDDDEIYRCMGEADEIRKDISVIEDNIADINAALGIATFEKRRSKTDISIAVVLGVISKNRKDIKNSTVKAAVEKIVNEYEERFFKIADEEYAIAVDYMADGDMAKAKRHLAMPNIMNYKDSEPLYAMLRLIVDNKPSEYDEIMTILVNTKDKVISEVHKGAVEDTISEIAKIRKATGRALKSLSYDVTSYNATYKALESVVSDSDTNDDDIAFMDWSMNKNKAVRDYEEKIKNGEYAINPMGDSDFPKDVETFPSADEIW